MKSCFHLTAFIFGIVTASGPGEACMMMARIDLQDVRYADTVVIGQIDDYRIVLDPVARKQRRELLASSPNMSQELRKAFTEQKGFLSDYARFEVRVEKVLVGKPVKSLSATWDNSTFGEPEKLGPGSFLIALRDPRSKRPPLRGPSATILPSPEPGLLTVL